MAASSPTLVPVSNQLVPGQLWLTTFEVTEAQVPSAKVETVAAAAAAAWQVLVLAWFQASPFLLRQGPLKVLSRIPCGQNDTMSWKISH